MAENRVICAALRDRGNGLVSGLAGECPVTIRLQRTSGYNTVTGNEFVNTAIRKTGGEALRLARDPAQSICRVL